MQALKVFETYHFKKQEDPRKVLGADPHVLPPYPQASPERFKLWFDREIRPYVDDTDAISDNIVMNDWESDWELKEYLIARGIEPQVADELLEARKYFNDKKYVSQLRIADFLGESTKGQIYEFQNFERGLDPRDSLGVNNLSKRIINRTNKIAAEMGFEQKELSEEERGILLRRYDSIPLFKWYRGRGPKYKIDGTGYQGSSRGPASFVFRNRNYPQRLVLLRTLFEPENEDSHYFYWEAGNYSGETFIGTFDNIIGWKKLFGPPSGLEKNK